MNTNILRSSLAALASVVILSLSGQVDGFNKGKGNMDVVGSLSYEQGLGYYLADGPIALKRTRIAFTVFAARGLTDDLDIQLSVPFISTTGSSGIQDAQLFLKWLPVKARLGNGRITFGAAIGGSMPVTDYQTGGVGAIGQQATSIIPMGVLQYTWDKGWFASFVAGQAIVEAPTPDALIGTLRAGHAGASHYVEAYLQAQEAFGGKDYGGQGDLAPTVIMRRSDFRELGVSFTKVGGKYYKPMGDRFGFVIDASYVVSGRNIDQAVMGAASFIVHFRK